MIRKILGAAALAALTTSYAHAQPAERTADEQKAFEIFEKIISMRTAKGHGQVPAMAEYLAAELRSAGFADDDIRIVPHDETAALIVRFKGDGSGSDKPILVLGHMDVVDAKPEDWELDPFSLTEKEGYFFGRGTTDNKYGIMNATQAFMRLKRDGFTPTRDIYIAFSGDEETGMETTRMLASDPVLANAEFALNTDAGGGVLGDDGAPLIYSLQAAEKTYATFEVTATNPGGHSSRPRADNAIYDLTEALAKVREIEFPVMANDITQAFFAATGTAIGGDVGEAMLAFSVNPKNKKAARILGADPTFVGMTRTTCVATMLRAGHAENALPQSATATVNCRIFPGQTVGEVQATLAEAIGNDDLNIKVLRDPTVSPVSQPRDDVMAALGEAVHARYADLPIIPYMESGGTDGMHFRIAGIPTWAMSGIFMKESDMFAHGLNERVPVDSFYAGLDHWLVILQQLAGAEPAQ